MRKFLIFTLTLLTLAAMNSCRSSRTLPTATNSPDSEVADWQIVNSPISVSLSKPMDMSFNGRLTMEKDRNIHLSMRVFGMEVALMYIDTDSLYFIDKYHKYMFAEPLTSVLGSRYNHLGVGDIQKLLLGQTKIPTNDLVAVTTDQFVVTPAGPVASLLSIVAETPQDVLEGSWSWKPENAKWNDESKKVTFKLPDNYRRITMENVESMFKSLNM